MAVLRFCTAAIGKRICRSCYTTWLPCETSIVTYGAILQIQAIKPVWYQPFHLKSQTSLIREVPTVEYVTAQMEGNDQHFQVALVITLFISPRIKLKRVTTEQKSKFC